MKLGKHVFTDLEVESLSIPTQTTWGHTAFQEGLRAPTSNTLQLKRQQSAILALQTSPTTLAHLREILKTRVAPHTAQADGCCSPEDPRVEESIHQILWSKHSLLAPLNIRAAIVSFLIVWKTLVLPGLSVLMPLLAVIVPFFIHRFVYGTPITTWDYMGMLRRTLLQQVSVPAALRAKSNTDTLGHVLESLFLGITVATFISGLWNQITAALHLRRIAGDLETSGQAIRQLRDATAAILSTLRDHPHASSAFRDILRDADRLQADLEPLANTNDLTAFGSIWNDRSPLLSLRTWMGRIDVLVTLASMTDICLPRFEGASSLRIQGVYHPSLAKRVENDAYFAANHVLLTGPNRGGKSTFCRSVGLAILTAQTWGFAWASAMTLAPFAFLETALKTRDELGALSLFEAEIEFAKSVLARAAEGAPIFVMMDEIFHSTNAHDGVSASQIFLQKLYTFPHVVSMISTHYGTLVELFQTSHTSTVQPWYMEAKEDDISGLLTYTYKVLPGISDKSSVLEILQERGLIEDVGNAAKLLKRVRAPPSEAAK